jgi:hypothetical protein
MCRVALSEKMAVCLLARTETKHFTVTEAIIRALAKATKRRGEEQNSAKVGKVNKRGLMRKLFVIASGLVTDNAKIEMMTRVKVSMRLFTICRARLQKKLTLPLGGRTL